MNDSADMPNGEKKDSGSTLVLLRHGESLWNLRNLFTGWKDVELTPKGEQQARDAGAAMREAGLRPDAVFTSLLLRAVDTAHIALREAGWSWLSVQRTWRLNERHYGALQGKDKEQIKQEHGELQFNLWRRSFDAPPPKIDEKDEAILELLNDPRYSQTGEEALIPRSECLQDVCVRLVPYYEASIKPLLDAGKNVLIVAHGNSIRALAKHIEGISDSDIFTFTVPNAVPIVYRFGQNGALKGGVEFLPV